MLNNIPLFLVVSTGTLQISTYEYLIKVRVETKKKAEELSKKKALDEAEKALRAKKSNENKVSH